jgi:hypothetical protein
VPREERLDAHPGRACDAGHQDGDDGSHREALCLLDALSPSPQVREVSLETLSIADVNADRREGLDNGLLDDLFEHFVSVISLCCQRRIDDLAATV